MKIQREPIFRDDEVGRVLREYQIPKDSAAGRRVLEFAMEQRRAAETGADYKQVRRGWCLGDKLKSLLCESFRKLRFQTAFDRFRMKSLPISACYWGDELPLHGIRQILLNHGFSEPWFSGGVGFRAERTDLAAMAEQILNRPVWIRLAGVAREAIQHVGDVLVTCGARFEARLR
jgi:hypothetical protein